MRWKSNNLTLNRIMTRFLFNDPIWFIYHLIKMFKSLRKYRKPETSKFWRISQNFFHLSLELLKHFLNYSICKSQSHSSLSIYHLNLPPTIFFHQIVLLLFYQLFLILLIHYLFHEVIACSSSIWFFSLQNSLFIISQLNSTKHRAKFKDFYFGFFENFLNILFRNFIESDSFFWNLPGIDLSF